MSSGQMLTCIVATCLVAAASALLVSRLLARFWRGRRILRLQHHRIPYSPDGGLLGDVDIHRLDLHRSGTETFRAFDTGVFMRRMFLENVVVISDPSLMAKALDRTKYPELIDKPSSTLFYKLMDEVTSFPPTSNQLTAQMSDPHWRPIRKGISAAFSPSNMRMAFEELAKTVAVLTDTLRTAGTQTKINMDRALQCQAFDAIASIGFNQDSRAAAALHGSEAQQCLAVEQAAISLVDNLRSPLNWLPFTPGWWKHRRAVSCVLIVLQGILQKLLDRETPCKEGTIAARLLSIRDNMGAPLPPARLWSEVSIFFLAGMETTAHTTAWTMLAIAQHPEVEARVLQELEELELLVTQERPYPRPFEHSDLSRLTYLDCVIKESMRVRPVVPMLFRQAMQDVRIGELLIPAGTILELHVLGMHTSPRVWDRPDDFLPERWFEADAEWWASTVNKPGITAPAVGATQAATVGAIGDKQDSNIPHVNTCPQVKRFLPFGGGARHCIGQPLARMNVTVVLASLLANLSIRLAEPTPKGAEALHAAAEGWRITLQPINGVNMFCAPRVPVLACT